MTILFLFIIPKGDQLVGRWRPYTASSSTIYPHTVQSHRVDVNWAPRKKRDNVKGRVTLCAWPEWLHKRTRYRLWPFQLTLKTATERRKTLYNQQDLHYSNFLPANPIAPKLLENTSATSTTAIKSLLISFNQFVITSSRPSNPLWALAFTCQLAGQHGHE